MCDIWKVFNRIKLHWNKYFFKLSLRKIKIKDKNFILSYCIGNISCLSSLANDNYMRPCMCEEYVGIMKKNNDAAMVLRV